MKFKLLSIIFFAVFFASAAFGQQTTIPRWGTNLPPSCSALLKNEALFFKTNDQLYQCSPITGTYVPTANGSGGGNGINLSGDANYISTSQFSDNLQNALSAIGTAKTTLLIPADAPLNFAAIVPATTTLQFTNGAGLVYANGGSIQFQDVGLENPESQTAIFKNFPNAGGGVSWTGANYPKTISSALWNNSNWGQRLTNATLAISPHQAKILHFDGGCPTVRVRVKANQVIHWKTGRFLNCIDDAAPIVVESNVTFTGDGKFNSLIMESNVVGRVAIIYASGLLDDNGNLTGTNENQHFNNIGFIGEPHQQISSSDSAIWLGNVNKCSIENVYTYQTHGFSFYVGGFNDTGNTAHGCSITNNLVDGGRTRMIGTVSGSGVAITNNIVQNVQPAIYQASNAVTNGTTGVTAAANNFGNWLVGATFRLEKSGQTTAQGQIVSVTNSNTLVLSQTIPYSASNVTLTITGPSAAVFDIEPNNYSAISENILLSGNLVYGQNAVQTWNCITIQIGGIRGTRNVSVQNNQCIGKDLVTGASSYMTYGLGINSILGGLISGNYFQGCTQACIQGNYSRYVTITSNTLIESGNGGNVATLFNSLMDSTISYNTIRKVYPSGSETNHSLTYQEIESTGVVNTNGNTVTVVSNVQTLPIIIGKTINISGVDYTITGTNANASTLTISPSAGTQTNAVSITKYSNNQLIGNNFETYDLPSDSKSVVVSRAQDFTKRSSISINPASVGANSVSTQTFTLSGAQVGDSLTLNPPSLTAGLLVLQSRVSAANQISITFQNTTGAAIDEAAGTWTAMIAR